MRPLEGIRILDLTRVLSGPYCTMLLGDLGAEVIKVERPGEGDDTRAFAPPFQGDQAAYFLSINRNKKSITLDMKSERGKQILWRLVDRVSRVAYTMAMARQEFVKSNFDAVLLDINIGGRYQPEIADFLHDRGVPFAFVTGYDYFIVPRHQIVPVLQSRSRPWSFAHFWKS